jgi:peptidoglycan hydrolase-like protein with peptidoglycan-binding domain
MKLSLIAAAVAAAMLSFGAVAQEKKQDSQGAQSPSSTTQEQKPGSSAMGSASGTTSGSAASGASSPSAARSPSASGDTQPRSASAGGQSQAAGDEKIKQVQQKLKDQGHDAGPVDGVMGPKTQAALKEFQSAKGLKDSGQLDRETMAALGVSGSASAGGSSDKSSEKKQ